jgi:hypothetical protein
VHGASAGIWAIAACDTIRQGNMAALAEAKFRCRKCGPTP